MTDARDLAAAILAALLPGGSGSSSDGLDGAIRMELLISVLQAPRTPRTLWGLLWGLQSLAAEAAAQDLTEAVRSRAEREPDLLLTELATRPR